MYKEYSASFFGLRNSKASAKMKTNITKEEWKNVMRTADEIKDFFAFIYEKHLRITDFFAEIIESGDFEEKFCFCIVTDGKITPYESDELYKTENGYEFQENNVNEAADVDEALRKIYFVKCDSYSFCDSLAVGIDEYGNELRVYYWAVIKRIAELNLKYLDAAREAYHTWISEQFINGWQNVVNAEEMISLHFEAMKTFHIKVKRQLGIDLGIINNIAGTDYEQKPCRATMCFCLSRDFSNYIVKLREPISLEAGAIRLHRKMLQMVQPGQKLVLKQMQSNDEKFYEWKILGIADDETIDGQNMAVFRLRNHADWVMEIGGKTVACYKCNGYKIEHDIFVIQEFEEHYEAVFQIPCTEEVRSIVRAAIEQNQGSALILIDKDQFESLSEESRIKASEEAVGFAEEEETVLTKKRFECFSAIDGTILLDKHGKCLRFGMMLNSEERGHGREERGSRFNSVDNYIENCKKEKIDAIGVVVSEDKTVNIIDTAHNEVADHGGEGYEE